MLTCFQASTISSPGWDRIRGWVWCLVQHSTLCCHRLVEEQVNRARVTRQDRLSGCNHTDPIAGTLPLRVVRQNPAPAHISLDPHPRGIHSDGIPLRLRAHNPHLGPPVPRRPPLLPRPAGPHGRALDWISSMDKTVYYSRSSDSPRAPCKSIALQSMLPA